MDGSGLSLKRSIYVHADAKVSLSFRVGLIISIWPVFQHFTKMEGIQETVTNSAPGIKTLMALGLMVAGTTIGILSAEFIQAKIWPLILPFVKCVRNKSCALAGLLKKLVPKQIFQRTVPVRAAATTDAEKSDVELGERYGGAAP